MEKRFTYISEFAGAGGACLGLKAAGGDARLMVEFDPYDKSQNAYQNLVENFPEVHEKGRILNRDICTVSGEEMLELSGLKKYECTVLQSSAPCQGFSGANTKRDVFDVRNDLFFETIKHIDVIRPELVILENVAGMVRGAMVSKYLQIINAVKALGYRTKTFVLDSRYYDCPQSRPRTWILCVREDVFGEITAPVPSKKVLALRDVFPNLDGFQQAQFDKKYFPNSYVVPTITKTAGFKLYENGEPRNPTIEELRILSTFPKNYRFVGGVSKVHERVGNAVLPRQLEILMNHLWETLDLPTKRSLHTDAEAA